MTPGFRLCPDDPSFAQNEKQAVPNQKMYEMTSSTRYCRSLTYFKDCSTTNFTPLGLFPILVQSYFKTTPASALLPQRSSRHLRLHSPRTRSAEQNYINGTSHLRTMPHLHSFHRLRAGTHTDPQWLGPTQALRMN